MKRFTPVLAVVLALSAAACTTAPTGPDPAGAPSFDGIELPPPDFGGENGVEDGGAVAVSGG